MYLDPVPHPHLPWLFNLAAPEILPNFSWYSVALQYLLPPSYYYRVWPLLSYRRISTRTTGRTLPVTSKFCCRTLTATSTSLSAFTVLLAHSLSFPCVLL